MCSWPKGGQNPAFKNHWQYMYFNECMTGFEWQAAAHMIWEGLDQPDILQNGLAVARAIHDRYDATLRNPYNEIECSDHYARAMASYGAYQAACGFHCHGPRGEVGFDPRLTPENFRCAFVTAEGWGSFAQRRHATSWGYGLTVRFGRLRLRSLRVGLPTGQRASRVVATVQGRPVKATFQQEQRHLVIQLEPARVLTEGENLQVEVEV